VADEHELLVAELSDPAIAIQQDNVINIGMDEFQNEANFLINVEPNNSMRYIVKRQK